MHQYSFVHMLQIPEATSQTVELPKSVEPSRFEHSHTKEHLRKMAEKGKAHQLEINLANPNPMQITQPPPEKLSVAERVEYLSNCHCDKQAVACGYAFSDS